MRIALLCVLLAGCSGHSKFILWQPGADADIRCANGSQVHCLGWK